MTEVVFLVFVFPMLNAVLAGVEFSVVMWSIAEMVFSELVYPMPKLVWLRWYN
jgi:hypothetical protein